MHADDAELIQHAQHGDSRAFELLVDRYGKQLFGLAYSLLGNSADAEDVLQETFIGAYRAVGKFEGRSSVKTWMTKILVRQVARLHRSRKNKRPMSLGEMDIERPDRAPITDGQMDVQQMLEVLSEEHREVMVLREIEGLSYEEMADVLDVPRGTVESRLHRARQFLKEKFANYLQE
ncbi:MAG TPA: sigma-70 family RNA polymerase sigma factor [Tepidisphaeraceae bacterium]